MGNKLRIKLGLLVFGFVIMGLFNNCGSPESKEASDGTGTGNASHIEGGFVDADYLTEEKPDLLCGQEGYAYLLKEYIGVHCAVCHDRTGGFEPYFAQNDDPSDSYYKALYINEEVFVETVTENRFCGKECSLNKEGETFKAIEEWLENKWACPQ